MATGRVPTTANSPLTAKGDLFGYSTTQARVPVGSDGETLVADSSASTGLRWQGDFAAGKNKIINGDFTINQRQFTSTQSGVVYTFDRYQTEGNGGVATLTWSAQTFTPGTAPVVGYESTNFLRMASTSQSTSSNYMLIDQKIEDVRTLANQTATVSFWAKASSGTPKVGIAYQQVFGTGGSSTVSGNISDVTISTTWTRYSATITFPSLSGKTIGTGSYLRLLVFTSAGSSYSNFTNIGIQNTTIDIWGIQLEAGSVATPFTTATGTLAGELAACQRYYYRMTAGSSGTLSQYSRFGMGSVISTSGKSHIFIPLKQTFRVGPTAVESGGTINIYDGAGETAATAIAVDTANTNNVILIVTTTDLTDYRPVYLTANNDSTAYIGFSAEL